MPTRLSSRVPCNYGNSTWRFVDGSRRRVGGITLRAIENNSLKTGFDCSGPLWMRGRNKTESVRIVIPLLCLLLCGCSRRVTDKEVTDSTGSNRLTLINLKHGSIKDTLQGQQSFDFDSLVWRTNADGVWHDRVVISKAAFQGSSPRRRWINQIHSVDATNGTAIIKVAEGDGPEGSPTIRFIYSWREWSLLTNGEVLLIRTCANPHEEY